MDDWQRREVENESRSRDINEWIQAANDDLEPEQMKDAYVCECSDEACHDPITLTRDEYELVRAGPTSFAIARNHENPEVDRVVSEFERYTVVQKWFGEAASIALATNPRR